MSTPAYVVTEEQIEAVRRELVREGHSLWSYQGRKISSARDFPAIIEDRLQDIALWAAIARKVEEPGEAVLDLEAERACKAMTGKSIRGYLNSEEGLGMSTKKFYDIARYVIERDEEKS